MPMVCRLFGLQRHLIIQNVQIPLDIDDDHPVPVNFCLLEGIVDSGSPVSHLVKLRGFCIKVHDQCPHVCIDHRFQRHRGSLFESGGPADQGGGGDGHEHTGDPQGDLFQDQHDREGKHGPS